MRRMVLLLAGVVATVLLSTGTSLAQSNDTDWSAPLQQDALAQPCEQASDQALEAADQLLLEEQTILDDLEQESNDLTAQLDEEEALLEQLIDEQSALDYEVQEQDAFVYELEEEWAALDYDIQEQTAYVDQLAQEEETPLDILDEEEALLDSLFEEQDAVDYDLEGELALLEQLIDEQSALDYEVQDQDAFVYELEEEWAALDYEIQEQAAFVDQLAQESSAECPQAPQPVAEQPVAEQPVAEQPVVEQAVVEQAPVSPSDTASNQQVSAGSPNAAASSESEEQAFTAFLQAQLHVLQSTLAQTQTSQVCEVFSYGYSLPNPLTGTCESRPSTIEVSGPQPAPATSSETPVGGNTTNPGPMNTLLGDTLFGALAKLTGTAAWGGTSNDGDNKDGVNWMYDRAKDGVNENGGPAPEEADPSGEFDPTGTKDNYTGE